MSEADDDRPISYIKILREIRDRLAEETADMTTEEYLRWCNSGEYEAPGLAEIAARAQSAKPRGWTRGGLAPYLAYKPSGVEGLGDVPAHWEAKRLKYVVSINDEVLPEGTESDYRMRYIDIGNVDSTLGITAYTDTSFGDAPTRARRIVRHGDTIVSTVRTYLRAIAPIRQPAPNTIVSTGFAVLRPKSSLLPGFAYYSLSSAPFIDSVVARSVGANYPAIAANDIGDIPIAVPAAYDQQAIMQYLDREAAKIDALIGKKVALVKRLKEYRTALVSRTVTRGLPPDEARKAELDPHPKLKPSGVEWLGEVPEHWDVMPLGRMGQFFKGSGGTRNDRTAVGVPCIRYGDIYTMYDLHAKTPFGFVSEETSRHYTPTKYGDVLFAGSGETLDEIGKSLANLIREPACCGGDVIVLRPAARTFDAMYSGYAIHSAHATWQKSCMGRGVTVMHIYASDLKHLAIPIPPLKEQVVIGAFLDRETGKIDMVIDLAHEEIKLLREYRIRLISDVVTGKVDVLGVVGTNVKAVA